MLLTKYVEILAIESSFFQVSSFKFIQKFKTLAKKRDWPTGGES